MLLFVLVCLAWRGPLLAWLVAHFAGDHGKVLPWRLLHVCGPGLPGLLLALWGVVVLVVLVN